MEAPCGRRWKPADLRNLIVTFRGSGFRGLFDALQPPELLRRASPSQQPQAEPDVPLADEIPTASPEWTHTPLLEYTHDAIIIWEMQGSGILYWNRAAEQLYGFTRAEAHGRTTHDLLGRSSLAAWLRSKKAWRSTACGSASCATRRTADVA
jgi:PAS domain-containing protein